MLWRATARATHRPGTLIILHCDTFVKQNPANKKKFALSFARPPDVSPTAAGALCLRKRGILRKGTRCVAPLRPYFIFPPAARPPLDIQRKQQGKRPAWRAKPPKKEKAQVGERPAKTPPFFRMPAGEQNSTQKPL